MHCPNCASNFVLRADYAAHVRRCQPVDADASVTDALLARLNAAASRMYADFDFTEGESSAVSGLDPAA